MTIYEFLEFVLPPSGHYCIQGFKGDTNKIFFCDSLHEAEDKANYLISEKYDTYFAVANFKTKDSRRFSNVNSLKVFMLDIDCGPTKPFKDQTSGISALSDFCTKVGLSYPTLIVDSGNGIHAYWVLDSAVPRDTWKVVADAFKVLCKKEGFAADPSVTADASRIMRMLGSHNYKSTPPLPTALLYNGKLTTFEKFKIEVRALGDIPNAPEHISKEPSELMKRHQESTRKSFEVLLEKIRSGIGCLQMEKVIQEQETVSYDAWRSGLSIARNCEEWETAIHYISSKHPDYTYEGTIKKAEDTIDKPHRCATFDAHSPKICDKCIHKEKITSPIELCSEFIEAKDNVVLSVEDGTAVTYIVPPLPSGYKRLATGGIYYRTKDGEDELVYEYDLYLVKRMYDIGRGDLALARLHLPREKPRDFIIPLSALTTKDKIKEILSSNGVIGSQRQMEAVGMYLIRFAKEQQVRLDLEILRSQFGWADDDTKFVLGEVEYSADGKKYSPPSEHTREVAKAIREKGDLEEWKKVANVYGNKGFEPEAFALFVGFGAMLMKFTNYKGAMINLLHPESGTGKTTILKVINSIVGHPDQLLSKESDTLAYKLHLLGVHNNIATTYDELTNTPPEVVSNLLYAVTHGKGANRMQSQNNIARKNETTWATLAVGSSNASLVQKLGVIKASANGEIMRLLEYRIEKKSLLTRQEAYEIFEGKMYQNYGVAGPVYVDWLVKNLSPSMEIMNKYQLKFDKDSGAETKERFWLQTVACAFAGGEIANELKLIDIPVEPVYKWAVNKLLPELRYDVKEEELNYRDILGRFIQKYMGNVLVIDDKIDSRSGISILPQISPRNELIIRIEPDTKSIFIVTKHFKSYCNEQQISYKDVLKNLSDSKVFVGETKKRMNKGTLIVSPAVYAYQFSYTNQDVFDEESLVNGNSRN